MRTDLLVHHRLGEGRLVALVVAEPAIAKHIDDHRLMEFLPEFNRVFRGIDDGLGVVSVDVNDWRTNHFRGIRRIGRGSASDVARW